MFGVPAVSSADLPALREGRRWKILPAASTALTLTSGCGVCRPSWAASHRAMTGAVLSPPSAECAAAFLWLTFQGTFPVETRRGCARCGFFLFFSRPEATKGFHSTLADHRNLVYTIGKCICISLTFLDFFAHFSEISICVLCNLSTRPRWNPVYAEVSGSPRRLRAGVISHAKSNSGPPFQSQLESV